jgi:hypothetical protein
MVLDACPAPGLAVGFKRRLSGQVFGIELQVKDCEMTGRQDHADHHVRRAGDA